MDKKCIKKIWTPKNKIFSAKLSQKNTKKQINNKNKAPNINSIKSITKKLAPKKPITQKTLDPKTHWLNNNSSISSTIIFSKKDAEVQNVV
jgi:hypothetical protein